VMIQYNGLAAIPEHGAFQAWLAKLHVGVPRNPSAHTQDTFFPVNTCRWFVLQAAAAGCHGGGGLRQSGRHYLAARGGVDIRVHGVDQLRDWRDHTGVPT
jgi:hypothetical protein